MGPVAAVSTIWRHDLAALSPGRFPADVGSVGPPAVAEVDAVLTERVTALATSASQTEVDLPIEKLSARPGRTLRRLRVPEVSLVDR